MFIIEILDHPHVKLFITSGGQQSTEDAIQNHVPVLGFPFNSDKTTNLDTCQNYGMGLWMDISDVTVENLNASIHQIINNPKCVPVYNIGFIREACN